jgi:PAS domain S-box-containing protein
MNGKVLDVNRRAVDLFGYSKEELVRKHIVDIHPQSERETIVSAFQSVLHKGSGSLSDTVIERKNGTTVPVDITGSVIQIGDKKVAQGLFRDMTERKRVEGVVRNSAEGVAASTGEAFFHSLVAQLARMLDMGYAFVGELSEDREDAVQTIAVWAGGGMGENFRYELAQTPCEKVVGKVLCCYPQGVQEQFPEDEMLRDMAVECYVGVPLFDSKGDALGLIAVLDTEPLSNPQFVKSTLRVFTARSSAELERKRAEEALLRSEANLRFLSSELLKAQEKEGARIARELHDGIGQSLDTLKMRVETLLQGASLGEGHVDLDTLSSLVPLIQETMNEVRSTSMDLRPSTLDTLGITATNGWFFFGSFRRPTRPSAL